MSKFSLPKDDDNKISPADLRQFAAGAKDHRTHKGPPPWDQYDPNDVPRHNVSVRLNDYHLAMLRWLAEDADMSQQKILKKVLVPAIEEQAENYIG